MSRRNTREGKARRRAEREARRALITSDPDEYLSIALNPDGSSDVICGHELARLAAAGETLPCGCDAHELMHGDGWHTVGE